MGWMMVPLTEYHGGGAAATIEPLHEHLAHYEAASRTSSARASRPATAARASTTRTRRKTW